MNARYLNSQFEPFSLFAFCIFGFDANQPLTNRFGNDVVVEMLLKKYSSISVFK